MADQGRALLAGVATDTVPRDLDLAALNLVAGGFDLVTGRLRGKLDISRERLEDFLVALVTARRVSSGTH